MTSGGSHANLDGLVGIITSVVERRYAGTHTLITMSVKSPYSRKAYPARNFGNGVKHIKDVTERMEHFVGGMYAEYNLSSVLYTHRLDDRSHVDISVWSVPGILTKAPFEEAVKQKYKPTRKGDDFGPPWTNHWFKITLNIPREWQQYERVAFEFDASGEALIFTKEGRILHGLTGGFGDTRRAEFIIPADDVKRGRCELYIESSCNEMFGQTRDDAGKSDPNRRYKLETADLVVINMDAQRLAWDFKTLYQLTQEIPSDSPLSRKAEWVANDIMNTFDPKDISSLRKCRKIAESILGESWEKEMVQESQESDKQEGSVWALGHCHIDTAWLWPFSVTQQKSARSWSSQLDIMERYPELHFSVTQAQQYQWLEELYPALFERIKKRIEDNHFQPVGCTWVEMDTNMPSGEALCRQFLYGQRYFESRFGFRSGTCVLPDTFGFSAQMPQIIRLSGAQDFYTIKLSWNLVNHYPNTTFNWVGLDGSQVLTHISPNEAYGTKGDVPSVRKNMTNHRNLDVTDQSILLFGNGDGGGGPKAEMMEDLRRIRAVGKLPDAGGQLPLVKMGGSFGEFFDSVRAETKDGALLPNWRGEMYLEFHRGTYTSHGSIKKGNRKSEIHLMQAEYAATMASFSSKDYKYPFEALDKSWQDLLLCQFHDVLPGSGIALIYEDAEKKYAQIAKDLDEVISGAHQVLYPSSSSLSAPCRQGDESSLFVVNTLPGQPREELVPTLCGPKTSMMPLVGQFNRQTGAGYTVARTTEQSSHGVGELLSQSSSGGEARALQLGTDEFKLQNGNVEMIIKDGHITSLRDTIADRELIPEGEIGGLVIFEDFPNSNEAWEIELYHLEKKRHLKFENVSISEHGPLRSSLSAHVYLDQSLIEVQISLDAVNASTARDSRGMVRFEANIDWKQAHQFLKFELPLDVHSETATYDIQFGTIQRPTHRNTSYEQEKFEVCGHKFADLSEFGYGVAIINDCKYGHAVDGNVMRLSLLRSPKNPDPNCDMHKHEINWAVYPHVGAFAESDVTQVAYAFNSPLQVRHAPKGLQPPHPFIAETPITVHGARNVILETIKRGEQDRDGKTTSIIVRLYEKFGGHARPTLKVKGMNVGKAEIVNILEDNMEDLKCNSNKDVCEIPLQFKGYEIKTVRLTVSKEESHSEDWIAV